MIHKLLIKYGIVKASLIITVLSILCSVLMYLIIVVIFWKITGIGIVISIIIPTITVPFLSYTILKYLFHQNIIEQKRAEGMVRESEKKYRLLVENAYDGILVVQSGVIQFANPRILKMLGYSNEELSKMPISKFFPFEEDSRIPFKKIEKGLRKKGLASSESFRVINKAGEEIWMELNTVSIDWEGRPATLNFLRDITERKKLEIQLQHAQKMESIGTIASGVAHNFRNILAGISVNSQLLQMKYRDIMDLDSILGRINRAIRRGSGLIDGLLKFSSKAVTEEFRILDLSQVIQEVYHLIRRSFDKKIEILVDCPEPLSIKGNASDISQVIMNLCVNARDAMPKGGVLRIEASRKNEEVVINISDTGQGMGKDALEKCFDPFFTTKEVGKGTGLGLSTSYGIIKDHGGDIHVYSEEGKGTIFRIYLPVVTSRKEHSDEVESEVIKGSGEKILIVDDETQLLKPMEDLLEFLGYRADSVVSGEAAIKKYTTWKPDAVLMDRNMPKMDGIACTKKILEKDQEAKIILISGYEDKGPSGIDFRTRRVISGYLTKPIDIVELSKILGQLFK